MAPQPGMPGVAIGRIADDGQPVGDRRRGDAPLRANAGFVVDDRPAAIPQDDPLATHQLGHVLVRRAHEDALDLRVVGEAHRGGGDGVVRLVLDHRPEDDPECLDGGLSDRELVEQLGRHPGRRLVAREQVVAERLDDPIRGAADVRRALLAQQVQELVAQPGHARQDDPFAPEDRRTRRVVRPEQLVRRVDQVEIHGRGSGRAAAGRIDDEVAQPLEVALEHPAQDGRRGECARCRA